MSLRRLLSVPRLTRNALAAFLDARTEIIARSPDAQDVSFERVSWKRRHIQLAGRVSDGAAQVGFRGRPPILSVQDHIDVELPRPNATASFYMHLPNCSEHYELAAPSPMRMAFARLVTLPLAFAEALQARHLIYAFLAKGDPSAASQLRRRFGLVPDTDRAVPVPQDIFDVVPPLPLPPVTIVIPVYDAVEDTEALLRRLPETLPPDTPVILVNDGSRDPRIPDLLKSFFRTHPGSSIIENIENEGFVSAVNKGIAAARPGDHIVLLNTDTMPPAGWLPRLMAPIALEPTEVASVTPYSNNAEILSVPSADNLSAPTWDLVERIDKTAARMKTRRIDLPTGIGFCMALNRRFVDQVGVFDPVFGRGYGEEVDWCQRALKAGGVHRVASLFVGHKGGSSFGAEEKASRIRASSRIISDRYPDYDQSVQRWLRDDPAGAEKLALTLAWVSTSEAPVPVFIGHSLGGGAEHALQGEMAALSAGGLPSVVLRVGGPRPWRIEVQGPGFSMAGDVPSSVLVRALLRPIDRRRVIYSCGVGAATPAEVPRMLVELCDAPDTKLELRLHDFFPISPSWNLLDSAGQFAGVPAVTTGDPAHATTGTTHQVWRQLWGEVVERADHIHVFAPSGRALLAEAYPAALAKMVVRPHRLPTQMPAALSPGSAIGVLGGINRAKGGAVLEQLAKHTSRRIVVIGEMDGQFRLGNPHNVHGRYDRHQITPLAQSYGVGVWLIPSICPETFSFATHEALATGLPVYSFDIGAQADALRMAPNGRVLQSAPSDVVGVAAEIEQGFSAG